MLGRANNFLWSIQIGETEVLITALFIHPLLSPSFSLHAPLCPNLFLYDKEYRVTMLRN